MVSGPQYMNGAQIFKNSLRNYKLFCCRYYTLKNFSKSCSATRSTLAHLVPDKYCAKLNVGHQIILPRYSEKGRYGKNQTKKEQFLKSRSLKKDVVAGAEVWNERYRLLLLRDVLKSS